MADSMTPVTANITSTASGRSDYQWPLTFLTSLFFMWGFITCLNDILIPHLKAQFDLNYTQAMLIQSCFFAAYFVVSLPAGALVAKVGYQRGIVYGLLTAATGCLLFLPAAALHFYPLFLFALFILASGITVLQVSANPYVTVLGPEQTASARLTLTQAFNSLGTTVAPFFGALLILGGSQGAQSVQLPYLLLAGMLLMLAVLFAKLRLPSVASAETTVADQVKEGANASTETSAFKARQYPHLLLGVAAIFAYVGAEVGIGSFLISFITLPAISELTVQQASHYIAFYFGGAMIGRFIGAWLMFRVRAHWVLAGNALLAVLAIAFAATGSGASAMYALLAVGLCNSVMFPTIFSLALRGLGSHRARGAGWLCMAIVGGAVMPLLQGVAADAFGVQLALLLPLVCYIYIAFFGAVGSQLELTHKAEQESA